MDEHHVTGTVKNVSGKVEEAFGRASGDTKGQVQGVIDQAKAPLRIYTAKLKTLRAMPLKEYERRQSHLRIRFATLSRTSHTPRSPSRSASDGCSAEFTARFDLERCVFSDERHLLN
jgi:uncharacterized protein YjbJ (UPF0337 family)